MEQILELLAAELERPRPLPEQVKRHLSSTYGVSRDEVGAFLERDLDTLEDYELDLILSPVFTPVLADQAVFAPVLKGRSLSSEEIRALVEGLVARPTVARLTGDDRAVHSVRLRQVSVERYVRRLRLEGSIPDAIAALIEVAVPPEDQPVALAAARHAVWIPPARRELLRRYLERAAAAGEFHIDDLLLLMRVTESYEPADVAEFLRRLPGWIDAARREAGAAMSPKPFFNVRVEDLHGGGRDQRRGSDPKAAAREAEMQGLQRLQRLLAE